MHRGSLHWIVPPLDNEQPAGDATEIQDIIAFDMADETFRWMRRPAVPGPWPVLFEVDGALALCGTGDGTCHTDVEVWEMRDYEAGVWDLMHQISLLPPPSQLGDWGDIRFICRMVVLNDREYLIRFTRHRLIHCQNDGELLRDRVLKCNDAEDRDCVMEITLHFLKENILPLPFFETQEEDGANKEHPFILGM
jgi:hypothetical protein